MCAISIICFRNNMFKKVCYCRKQIFDKMLKFLYLFAKFPDHSTQQIYRRSVHRNFGYAIFWFPLGDIPVLVLDHHLTDVYRIIFKFMLSFRFFFDLNIPNDFWISYRCKIINNWHLYVKPNLESFRHVHVSSYIS